MNESPEKLTQTAAEAARAGLRSLRPFIDERRRLNVREKASRDFVTAADLASQRAIHDVIRRAWPTHAILAEEDPGAALSTDGPLWIVDPLDGTANFIHGYPASSVSVGFARDGRVIAAAIADVVRDHVYTAALGAGAKLNREPIRVSGLTTLSSGLIATGFPFRRMHRLEPFTKCLGRVLQQVAGVRRAGSAALDFAWVASGRLDGFWEEGLGPWDIAAGSLIVQEAGGTVTDFSGGSRYLETGAVVAASPAIQEALRRIVFECQGEGV
jgi:myo-inositol-1(or 4)-monophosphatase